MPKPDHYATPQQDFTETRPMPKKTAAPVKEYTPNVKPGHEEDYEASKPEPAKRAPAAEKKMSFKEKFAAERKAGAKTFEWNGKKYTTELASSAPKKATEPKSESKPAPKVETPKSDSKPAKKATEPTYTAQGPEVTVTAKRETPKSDSKPVPKSTNSKLSNAVAKARKKPMKYFEPRTGSIRSGSSRPAGKGFKLKQNTK